MCDIRITDDNGVVFEFSIAEIGPGKWRVSLDGAEGRSAILVGDRNASSGQVLVSAIRAAISVVTRGEKSVPEDNFRGKSGS